MGVIQGAINQLVGTAAAGAVVGKHISTEVKQQKLAEAKNQADIAATEEQLAATKQAYRNDTIEAAKAINAHEGFDPEIAAGRKFSSYNADELANLSDDEVKTLAAEVDKIRAGKLTEDRIQRLESASNLPEEGRHTIKRAKTIKGQRVYRTAVNVKTGKVEELYRDIPAKHIPGKYISNKDYKNQELEKAYDAFRELNNRIATSRELKFDISAAEAKIRQLKTGGNE